MFSTSTRFSGKPEACYLDILWVGLSYLYDAAAQIEKNRIAARGIAEKPAREFVEVSFGSDPDEALICNYFIWYASAGVKFLHVLGKSLHSNREYFVPEFQAMLFWRNKVAAHTSWDCPKKEDSFATQSMSLALFPEFDCGRFTVGGTQVFSDIHGASNDSWKWCLVGNHELLKKIVESNL